MNDNNKKTRLNSYISWINLMISKFDKPVDQNTTSINRYARIDPCRRLADCAFVLVLRPVLEERCVGGQGRLSAPECL